MGTLSDIVVAFCDLMSFNDLVFVFCGLKKVVTVVSPDI